MDAHVWVCVFIYLYMEAGAFGEEIRIFVKEFERNSVTWRGCKRQYVSFMVWTSRLLDFGYPAALGWTFCLALASVAPSVWVSYCWTQSSVLLLVSLCAILLLYICCRWHELFSGFHCPCNMDKIFLSSFQTSICFLKFPIKCTSLKGVWPPPPRFPSLSWLIVVSMLQ